MIPYDKVDSLEYGQNVSRRYVAAVLISPVFLLSKPRKHFVTVGYTDNEGRQQASVFRVSKGELLRSWQASKPEPGGVSNTRMTMPAKMASNAGHTPRVGQSCWPVMAFPAAFLRPYARSPLSAGSRLLPVGLKKPGCGSCACCAGSISTG